MFGSGAIDVAIGLGFVFVLLSLICSSVTELISQLLGWRAQTLEQGIHNLITDPATREAFYRHPLIRSLGNPRASGERGHPSYLPSHMFALVLLDVLAPSQTDQKAPAKDQAVADDLRRALQALAGTAGTNLDVLRAKVEGWFDDVMDRASGWYKRKAQWMLLVTALVVTAIANADAISLATSLWRSPLLRASVVEAASAYTNGENETLDELSQHLDDLANRGLPLGWGGEKVLSSREAGPWATKLAGLLLTALAASLGAPFWFDLVNKLINVRSTGTVPPPSSASAAAAEEADKHAQRS